MAEPVVTRDNAAEERIRLAREALLATGYYRPEEVGDDIAPRITELWSAMVGSSTVARRAQCAHKPGDPHQYRITCEVCGERGTIRLTVDPETILAAPTAEDTR